MKSMFLKPRSRSRVLRGHPWGLLVDQFGDTPVVQALTLVIDMRLLAVATILHELTQAKVVVFRNDASVRKL